MTVKKAPRAYTSGGRVHQKLRTRSALIEVAADLIKQGRSFSVADVADLAKVGRTTAYRYFPTPDQLLAHAALWKIGHLERDEFEHILTRDATTAEKVDALVLESDKSTRAHEEEYRAMLRSSLERVPKERGDLPGRIGFRKRVLSKALAELEKKLGTERFERLIGAVSLTLGIEALIVLNDVCLLPPDRGQEIKRWAARVLLESALSEVEETQKRGVAKQKSKK
jgi:AcrR family transcriptional regulator